MVRMGETRGAYRVLMENPEEKRPLEDLGIDRRIILKCKFKKWRWGAWTGLFWLRIGTGSELL